MELKTCTPKPSAIAERWIAHSLSAKRGDRMTYMNGLQDVIEFKKQFPNQELI